MPYSDDMIKAVCDEMGIDWDESSQQPMLNHKPLNQKLNIKELFSVDAIIGEVLCQVTELKVEEQSNNFDCSKQYLDAA